MENKIDVKQVFSNIYFLMEEKDIRVGQLEKELGVSSGYIARTYKDGGKPSIDFLWNVSQILHTHIDILISVNLSKLTETERFIIDLIEKLNEDTSRDELNWKAEEKGFEREISALQDGTATHPIFDTKEETSTNPAGYPDIYYTPIFLSKAFGEKTLINDTCYYTEIEGGADIYLMSVKEKVETHIPKGKLFDPEASKPRESEEVWIYQNGSKQCLASTIEANYLKEIVMVLRESVADSVKHIKIDSQLKKALNQYMKTAKKERAKDEGRVVITSRGVLKTNPKNNNNARRKIVEGK